jgi:YdjC-like protein
VMLNEHVPAAGWTHSYVEALRSVQSGLTYLIVHLGHDSDELRAITLDHPDYGSAWRERDFQAVTSPEFKRALEENHIVLIHWKDLQRVM